MAQEVTMGAMNPDGTMAPPSDPNAQAPTGPLKVLVLGENSTAAATVAAFDVPRGVEVYQKPMSQLEDLETDEEKYGLIIFCDSLEKKKNGTLDDEPLIVGLVKALNTQPMAGLVVRTTVNSETMDRMISSCTKQAFDVKVVYMPDTATHNDVANGLALDYQLLGGTPEAIQALMNILKGLSNFNSTKVLTGLVHEICYTQLAISGYALVMQQFMDELHDAVLDMKNANPIVVRRLLEESGVTTCRALTIPSAVKGRSEFDSAILTSSTDELTLIDHCLEN